MSTQHTPGLITVKRGQFGSSVFVLYGSDGFPIAQTISNSSPEGMERARRGEHEANARRLAACWNACEGAPTEWLDENTPVSEIASEIRKLNTQRDALLAAAQWAIDNPGAHPENVRSVMRDAISKAANQKGGT